MYYMLCYRIVHWFLDKVQGVGLAPRQGRFQRVVKRKRSQQWRGLELWSKQLRWPVCVAILLSLHPHGLGLHIHTLCAYVHIKTHAITQTVQVHYHCYSISHTSPESNHCSQKIWLLTTAYHLEGLRLIVNALLLPSVCSIHSTCNMVQSAENNADWRDFSR